MENQKEDSFSIFVNQSGDISYLHKEAFSMNEFGLKEVTRASVVEFDQQEQKWVAVLNDGREIARNESRDAVLSEERNVIEAMIASGKQIPQQQK